jgi:hypothetical protein
MVFKDKYLPEWERGRIGIVAWSMGHGAWANQTVYFSVICGKMI